METLGGELSRLIRRHQKRVDRAIWGVPLFYSVLGYDFLLGNRYLGAELGTELLISRLFYASVILFWAVFTGFMIGAILSPRKKLRQKAQTLASLNDVRAVCPLIDTWKMEDGGIHKIANQALIDLLPRLRSEDSDLLNAEQRILLYRALNRAPNRNRSNIRIRSQEAYQRKVAFQIAALQALAQVGDRHALPTVERLARREAQNQDQQRIRDAAQECLPLLKLRIEQQYSNETLLRASRAFDATGDTLLRAAHGVQQTSSEQLLRPGPPAR